MIYFSVSQQTFFDDVIHTDEQIPNDVVTIDGEQHQKLLNALNFGARVLADLSIINRPSLLHEWYELGQVWVLPEDALAKALQRKKEMKLQQLNNEAQAFIAASAHTDKVPEFELQSWVLQAIEAKAWAQDKTIATPVLDKIAAARGVPADVLKQAALRKTQAYEALTTLVAGQRQALQTQIELAKSLDDLNAIEIAFRLPETGGNP